MDSRQSNAQARALAREAIGKLRAAQEWIGTSVAGDKMREFQDFDDRVSELERWIFEESVMS